MNAHRPYDGTILQADVAAGPRVTSAGGSVNASGVGPVGVARLESPEARTYTITSRASPVTGSGDLQELQHHKVILRVSWATKDGGQESIFDCGKRVQLTGSAFNVNAQIVRDDGQPVIANALSTVSAFIAEGAAGLPCSRWIEPLPGDGGEPALGLHSSAIVSPVPATLVRAFGTNMGATEGTILFYDVPNLGPLTFSEHNSPVRFAATVPPGIAFSLDMPEDGKQFANGIAWIVSSSRTSAIPDATALFRVDCAIGGY